MAIAVTHLVVATVGGVCTVSVTTASSSACESMGLVEMATKTDVLWGLILRGLSGTTVFHSGGTRLTTMCPIR